VTYYLLLQSIEPDERANLDNSLGVSTWQGPVPSWRPPVAVEPGTPPWWGGDEDASQGFLAEMGVTLADGEQVR
jgi:hypothetical protein